MRFAGNSSYFGGGVVGECATAPLRVHGRFVRQLFGAVVHVAGECRQASERIGRGDNRVALQRVAPRPVSARGPRPGILEGESTPESIIHCQLHSTLVTGYLIRVGLDQGYKGGEGLAPIDREGNFSYIPIPEDAHSEETRTYGDQTGELGGPFVEYTERGPDQVIHYDPEFESYTYGEVGPNKARTLRKLSSDDLLVFYAGLRPLEGEDRPRVYIIGYFTIEGAYDLQDLTPEEREQVLQENAKNAHAKRTELTPEHKHPARDRFPVIIVGDPERSQLLPKAIPLSSTTETGTGVDWYQKYRPLNTAANILGIESKDLKRSQPRALGDDAEEIREWLSGTIGHETTMRPYRHPNTGEIQRVEEDVTLYSYVLSTDTGFAPHIGNGVLSLAACKPAIRRNAEVGDWVIGTGSTKDAHVSQAQLLFAARVEETLSTGEYFCDDRFEHRQPLGTNSDYGDNMYVPRELVEDIVKKSGNELPDSTGGDSEKTYEQGDYTGEPCFAEINTPVFQLASGQHPLSLFNRDVGDGARRRVLISSDFYYFGDADVEMPESLAESVVRRYGSSQGRQYHATSTGESVVDFVEYLRTSYRPGIHGDPSTRDSGDVASVSEEQYC